ncbi:amino acid ABC transporter ATP-binding/permease protein [Thomasclavelia cocleata]|uniref:amino acid ABC transporter ATP-binding/permease protein n=1 Tax=Thomasclavelia cocleata TaxID=69824 RepID=UPI00242F29C5|nr:ABC transporter ATP-binding protein [Thomasclavelia cocleata]MCI9131160.1 ABC transporter ATP-binding protein [Thomasclavelia cocleata]
MKKRSNLKVVISLIALVKSMILIMLLAIFLGVIGYLAAIFLTIIAGEIVIKIINKETFTSLLYILIACGILRGFLRYGEQWCNHFIAFKLLAMIRDIVFGKLRKLAPAKLDGKDQGNLVTMITSDVELLEVFYAHTISPVIIALIVSIIMIIYLGQFHIALALLATVAYLFIGIFIPFVVGKVSGNKGLDYRNTYGKYTSYILESIHGLRIIDQFLCGDKRLNEIERKSELLNSQNEELKDLEGQYRMMGDICVSFFSLAMFILGYYLYLYQLIDFKGVLISTIALMSSFGPVLALSSLAHNLVITFASGNRVLDLLDEKPQVEEVVNGYQGDLGIIELKNLSFKYEEEIILDNIDLVIRPGEIIGIEGRSGSGKTTLLKLLMRFYDSSSGEILIDGHNLKSWQSDSLAKLISYVTQDTYIFNDTIINNIKLGMEASDKEVMEACKKANLHEFIISLKEGYETMIGSLYQSLSGGQLQRLSLARAFLHDSPLILLDEPTSNLDSLNEALVLKSLNDNRDGKTIILVSHRPSSLKICDRIIRIEQGRQS